MKKSWIVTIIAAAIAAGLAGCANNTEPAVVPNITSAPTITVTPIPTEAPTPAPLPTASPTITPEPEDTASDFDNFMASFKLYSIPVLIDEAEGYVAYQYTEDDYRKLYDDYLHYGIDAAQCDTDLSEEYEAGVYDILVNGSGYTVILSESEEGAFEDVHDFANNIRTCAGALVEIIELARNIQEKANTASFAEAHRIITDAGFDLTGITVHDGINITFKYAFYHGKPFTGSGYGIGYVFFTSDRAADDPEWADVNAVLDSFGDKVVHVEH